MSTPLRILLVNDDEDGLYLLERAVVGEFHSAAIWKSRSASEALELLHCQAVDLIVTDQRMQAMDGIEMVRLIRARDARTPILMLTGSEHLKTTALEAGVTSFLASGNWDVIRKGIREAAARGND